MLERSKIPTAALNELVRLRLAVSMQVVRLKEAHERLEEIPEKRRAVLIDVSTRENFDPQATAELIQRLGTAEVWLVKNEVQFLVNAVNGIYRMARVLRWATSEQPLNSGIHRAISAFEAKQPHAKLLRDLHEHMDEVMRGQGRAHSRLPDPDMESVIYLDEATDDVIYAIGGQVFRIKPLAEAALELAAEIRELYD